MHYGRGAIVDGHASNVFAGARTERSRGDIITVKALKIRLLFDAAPPQLRKYVTRVEFKAARESCQRVRVSTRKHREREKRNPKGRREHCAQQRLSSTCASEKEGSYRLLDLSRKIASIPKRLESPRSSSRRIGWSIARARARALARIYFTPSNGSRPASRQSEWQV